MLAIAKSMSRFRQGSKVLLLPPRPRPSPAALIAGREQFRHVKGQVAKRELWYADIQGDVSGESNPIATSAQFVAVAWRATGGGRCFPPPPHKKSVGQSAREVLLPSPIPTIAATAQCRSASLGQPWQKDGHGAHDPRTLGQGMRTPPVLALGLTHLSSLKTRFRIAPERWSP